MEHKIKKIKKIIIVFLLLLPSCVFSATREAESCSQEHVQSAINLAEDGDIVTIPARTCIWTTHTQDQPSVNFGSKTITIQGAGIDKTIITDGTETDWKEAPFWITGAEGKPFRITGITFNGTSDGNGSIAINGTCKNFRIDHCKFNNDDVGISTIGYTYGVIDNCDFVNVNRGILVQDLANLAVTSWARPLTLGTTNAVFIEDCTFTFARKGDSAVSGQHGGRYVFRHNTVIGSGLDMHGYCSSAKHSNFSFEAYNNTFSAPIPNIDCCYRGLYIRGGTGVAFNNTFSSEYTEPLHVADYQPCNNVHGLCDPALGVGVKCTSYSCEDQVGRSTGQSLEPVYEWNNTRSDGITDVDIAVSESYPTCDPNVSFFIQENRDFYNDTQRPGYTPYTYPHPLRNENPSDPVSPANPSGLSVR